MAFNHKDAQSLSDYADQLYFGMLSFNPSSVLTAFLTRYVPVIFKPRETNGWTAYPKRVIEEPEHDIVTHSFVFNDHPLFRGDFKVGQLAITQKIYVNEKWNENITAIKLWFEFDIEKNAKEAYQQLVNTFSGFKTLKRTTSQFEVDKTEFTDKESDLYYGNIQIVLATDYSLGRRHVTPIDNTFKFSTEAGYRLLVEIGNDLY